MCNTQFQLKHGYLKICLMEIIFSAFSIIHTHTHTTHIHTIHTHTHTHTHTDTHTDTHTQTHTHRHTHTHKHWLASLSKYLTSDFRGPRLDFVSIFIYAVKSLRTKFCRPGLVENSAFNFLL